MEGSDFDEVAFFRALATARDEGRVRALLMGRRALVLLGLPVLTADYDFWINGDDAETFNDVASSFGLVPSRTPQESRQSGRYVLENDEHVDVLTARSVSISAGGRLVFDEIWDRRVDIDLAPGVTVSLPALDDLIATKRIKARPKDLEDIRLLEALRERHR
jgi:hypothetical protein